MEKTALLRSLVMDAIANDYEDFATIVEDVAAWASERDICVTAPEISASLFELVKSGLAKAYALSNSPREVQLNDPPDGSEGWYFLLTKQGRQAIEDY